MSIIDAVTRHQIFVQRYAAGREQEAQAFIERLLNLIEGRMTGDITQFSRSRLDMMLSDIRLLHNDLYGQFSQDFIDEILEFAQYELDFNERMLNQNLNVTVAVPGPAQLQSAMFTSIMNLEPTKGYTIGTALAQFGTLKANQIVQTIRDGIALGDTHNQIRSRVQELGPQNKNQAASLTRTITNHVSIQARDVTLRENEDLFDGYEWVATLDSRTSLICASRDGIIYPFGNNPQTSPKPPAHFSCRSSIVPVIKPEYDATGGLVGERPQIGADGRGVTKGSTTYEQWLKRQPASFQDEILGPSRGKLFRRGEVSIGRFVDNQGRTLTLDELRQLEPLAFEQAGI